MKLFAPLLLLAAARAFPTPEPIVPSIFQSSSVPVVDHLDLSIFNLTSPGSNKPHPRDGASVLDKRALTLNYILCSVTFDGANQGNQVPFRVSGQLLITSGISSSGTRNGANPVELVIAIGNPYSNPVAGSIRYTTNRYLWPFLGGAPDTSRVDFAYVASTATTVGVTVDTSLAAANTLSVFNTRSGLTADVYNPASGGVNLVLANNGAVSGQVQFVGRSLIGGAQGSYRAKIVGSVIQKGTTTL